MIDLTPDIQQWMALHASDDTMRLRLRHHGDPDLSQAIDQIERRRRAASRFPEALSHSRFIFPTDLSIEQATSEALARVHAGMLNPAAGSSHLDLSCGLGMDAFEMGRRGAEVTAVDINPEVVEAALHNSGILGLGDNFTAVCSDSADFVAAASRSWDTVFIDPARRGSGGRRLVALADCTPDVTTLMPRLLALAPRVMVKASPMLDMTAVIAELNGAAKEIGSVSLIAAIGTTRECKEVVAIVERGFTGRPDKEAITVVSSSESPIVFASTGRQPSSATAIPEAGSWLYEPYPAVMKLAAWADIVTLGRNISQLHPNTHLFTSPESIDGFPGLSMRIERAEPLSDKALRSIAKDYPQANVTTRNFIISAPELARRLKVKEGGTTRIYGVRAGAKGALMVVVASPV